MPARLVRLGFRMLFLAYVSGLVCWLLLGLLPTLAQTVPLVHGWLGEVASGSGALAVGASRVLGAGPAVMSVSTPQALLQYGFSALNMGLGLLLFAKRPDARETRLLAFAMLGTAATFNAPSHIVFHITGSPWPIALAHFTFHIVSGVCYLWAVVLFPDGQLPRRLRAVPGPGWAWVSLVTIVVVLVSWRGSFLDHPLFFVVFFGIVVALAGTGAQLLQLTDHDATPADRATARLLVAALLPALAAALLLSVAWLVSWAVPGTWFQDVLAGVQDLFPATFALVPVVLCAGVVRYRLWDIDRLLSRVLVYGIIAGMSGAAYVLAVVAAGNLGHGTLWSSVVALALAASAFEPLRRIAGAWANRVVYGQVVSPQDAMRSLVSGFEQLTPAGGVEQVEKVTVQATRASEAALWLVDDHRLVEATGSPAAGHDLPAGDTTVKTASKVLGVGECWPVSHLGEPLGFLAVKTEPGVNLTAEDRVLIGDVAAHAGLLLNNALLTAHLAREVQDLADGSRELRTARRRLVTAQDKARAALERDLHDGAQQALVAAMVGLRMLGFGQDTGPELASLTEVLDMARSSLGNLGGGDRPADLARFGLVGALQRAATVAGVSGLAVHVELRQDATTPSHLAVNSPGAAERLRDAETAVYFCCLEGLQNTAKYADAKEADILVVEGPREIGFSVTDNGRGFDASASPDPAGGLPRLAQRLALLGGSIVVESAPGRGTRLTGWVPHRSVVEAGR